MTSTAGNEAHQCRREVGEEGGVGAEAGRSLWSLWACAPSQWHLIVGPKPIT